MNITGSVQVVLSNVTSPWKNLIKKNSLLSYNGTFHHKENVNLDRSLQYPFCRILDPLAKLNFNDNNKINEINEILLQIKSIKAGLSIVLLDKQRVARRPLKTARFSYSGPIVSSVNLEEPKYIRFLIKISQTINFEGNKNYPCKMYEENKNKSFGECDDQFVENKMKQKYNITPFWATDDLDDVTERASFKYTKELGALYKGDIESPCMVPCILTQVCVNYQKY